MNDKVTASDPAVIDREAKVVGLRRLGASFAQIAVECGYANGGGAYKAFQRACARIVYEDVTEMRMMELERLDAAQRAIMNAVANGRIPAINTLLRIMERRARLCGLDAPIKQEIEINHYDRDGLDAELAELIAKMDSSEASVVVEEESASRTDT
jgi:hypothetical protein